ncbi:hypothetical protein [Paenibacillus sp. MMO-177]|uniref:hypothetical protein n=1 Tax=Paenibacillus sp. MMO-177 TaxID=3081289 RepID=UPI0030195366
MKYTLDSSVLSERERTIWVVLKERYGNENAITSGEVQTLTGIDRFGLAQVVQTLRLKHKIPVTTSKYGNKKGYFLPVKPEEIDATMTELEAQASKLIDVSSVLWEARKLMTHAQTGL